MYAQRRITSIVHGLPYTHLEALVGWKLLEAEMEHAGLESDLTK